MITNLPTANDYINVAKQCLIQAFNIVYDIDKDLIYSSVPSEDVWEYHLGDLSTSLILVHQAIESLQKGAICEVSPLLLLDLKKTDWPTLPSSSNKEYSELFTIGGEALLRTYCSVVPQANINEDLLRFIESIRLSRNKVVHGADRDYIDPEYLINIILSTFSYFLGKDTWWLTMKEVYMKNPLFGELNSDYEEAYLVERLNYVEEILEPQDFRKHFNLNIKARRYHCPWCNHAFVVEDSDMSSQWAFLIPQRSPKADKIFCLSCQKTHAIVRNPCIHTLINCKGDVQHQDLYDGWTKCLTCYRVQD